MAPCKAGGSAGAAWAQVAIHCWAQAGLLLVTLASVQPARAALGERARGLRSPRCGQQSKSREWAFWCQVHISISIIFLGIRSSFGIPLPTGSVWPWVPPSPSLPCHYCSGPATSLPGLICPTWHLSYPSLADSKEQKE